MTEDLPSGSPHTAHEVEQVPVADFQSFQQTDCYREEAYQDNDDDLGQQSVTQPEDEQGSHSYQRYGLRKDHKRVENTFKGREQGHHRTCQNSHQDSQSEPKSDLKKCYLGMTPD